ncbi:MAG: polysaccharide deacetylase family protein [Thermodesulfobacteriota bacterium]|nr:polysaccharide deacetylase family protein [Thermodesulfobacteriota bacterium]
MDRRILLVVICATVLITLFSGVVWSARQATVFVYHRFGDGRYSSTNIDLHIFEQQLAYLKLNNYTVLPVGDIVQRLSEGIALPDRCVALTVDDGYTTFLTGAMPLLRQYGFPVTLFVSTDAVGGGSYLNWEQLRQLQQEGVEIGNHSASHPYFVSDEVNKPERWLAESIADIEKAQQAFAQHLGCRPTLFAYPYGEYSPAMEILIENLGFAAAFAQQSGVISAVRSFYSLPRFPMGGAFATLQGFKSKLTMRPMPIVVHRSTSPIVGAHDPPELIFSLDNNTDIAMSSLRCYVQGQDSVAVEADGEGNYRVVAGAPLSGRRNKYTLTAQSRDGRFWYWFSHPWIHP